VLGLRLDSIILRVSSNLNDFMNWEIILQMAKMNSELFTAAVGEKKKKEEKEGNSEISLVVFGGEHT